MDEHRRRFVTTMSKPYQRRTRPLEDRLWEKVEKTESCWNWTGAISNNGYGKIGTGGRDGMDEYVHRITYRWAKGPIPEGMEIDHLCRNRRCCNPDHLEAVPPRVNSLRGEAPNVVLYREQRCIHGHDLTPENTYYINEKGRGRVARCRTCRQAASSRWKRGQSKKARGLPYEDNKGSRNGMSKMTNEQVARILREFLTNPRPPAEIAAAENLKMGTIQGLLGNRSWTHVEPEIRTQVKALMIERARQATLSAPRTPKRGQDVNTSKLTPEIVLELRRRFRAGEKSYKRLGDEFGVTGPSVHAAVHYLSWKHLP
jgi:hypothetical protein